MDPGPPEFSTLAFILNPTFGLCISVAPPCSWLSTGVIFLHRWLNFTEAHFSTRTAVLV